MRPIGGNRILASAQRGFRNEIKPVFLSTAQQIGGILTGVADRDGIIPRNLESQVVRRAGEIVQRLFVGFDGRSAFGSNGVTAQAQYPQILNKWLVFVTAKTVYTHRDWMQKNIPEDVYTYLATKRSRPVPIKEQENPFLRRDDETVEEHIERLRALRIFDPNPLAEYEPAHTWVDPNGYVLSDRIWNTSIETRKKVDNILREGIRNGTAARDIAKQLEQFLVPGRALVRTNRPYGSDASFDAMRLARTEISRAAAQAAFISAYLNPYVGGMDWALSPSHPRIDICDDLATIGKGGERLRDPMAMTSTRLPPAHPHCLCRAQAYVTDTPEVVTQQLHAMMEDAEQQLLIPVITPAQADTFIQMLLGDVLAILVPQVLAA